MCLVQHNCVLYSTHKIVRCTCKLIRISSSLNGQFCALAMVAAPGSGGETNMANLKSYNPSPAVNSGSTKRARLIGGAVTAAATAVLVLTFVLDFNGCSSSKKSASVNSSSQNQSIASPSPTPVVQTVASLENKVEAVIEKKKPIKR